MASNAPRVVGILAGGGSLPREIAEHVVAHGDRVHIVALAGEADGDFVPFPTTGVGWAQIGAMVGALQAAQLQRARDRRVACAVRISLRCGRTWGFFRNLPAILRIIAAGGDDSVLTRVVRFFEEQGFRVLGPRRGGARAARRRGTAGARRGSTRRRKGRCARLRPCAPPRALRRRPGGRRRGRAHRRRSRVRKEPTRMLERVARATGRARSRRRSTRRAGQAPEAGPGAAHRSAGDRARHGGPRGPGGPCRYCRSRRRRARGRASSAHQRCGCGRALRAGLCGADSAGGRPPAGLAAVAS